MVGEAAGNTTAYWPLLVYAVAAVITVTGMVVLSWLLGERHHETATDIPYESGILPTGTARLRLSVSYYLVAVFFVVFDLEAAFIFAWAVCARSVGWQGYLAIVVFILFLLAAWLYLWRERTLDTYRAEEFVRQPDQP